MKKRHALTSVAMASALSISALVGTGVAGAATHASPKRATAQASVRAARSIGDATFTVARRVESANGDERVVFYATDHRTGRTLRMN